MATQAAVPATAAVPSTTTTSASTTASGSERRAPPAGLNLNNLSSNNPFRNRNNPSPSPSSADPRLSRFPMAHNNPFLDASEVFSSTQNSTSAAAPTSNKESAKATTIHVPDDIFNDLSLLDKPRPTGPPSGQNRPLLPEDGRNRSRGPPPRGQTDISPAKREYKPHRRASESSIMEKSRQPPISRDDREREKDRARADRPPRTESEERRRRERRREREERHRAEKEKDKSGASSSARRSDRTRRPQGLDIIDKLDVTGVYGQGLFHHDGPFDACNPHRNAKKDRRAPLHAFPADSANMAIGGFGPVSQRLDLDRFHGRGEEGFADYSHTLRRRGPATNIVDPTARTEPVHGEETSGLGTSTFLEGAPASRSALQQRRDSAEDAAAEANVGAGGLGRKKSLAQRFRGMSGSGRNMREARRSPEARYTMSSSPPGANPTKAQSAGGPARATFTKDNEVNPFFDVDKNDSPADYDSAFDKKGAQIRVAERTFGPDKSYAGAGSGARPVTSAGPGSSQPQGSSSGGGGSQYHHHSSSSSHYHSRAASNPRGAIGVAVTSGGPGNGLVRTVTSDSTGRGSSSEVERTGGGFMRRMKSLKGGKRQAKPEAV